MDFAKKSDLDRMITVSRLGNFGNICLHFEGSWIRGECLRFPPYMGKAPPRVEARAVVDPPRPSKIENSYTVWALLPGFPRPWIRGKLLRWYMVTCETDNP